MSVLQTHTIGKLLLNLELVQPQQAYARMEAWKEALQTPTFLTKLNELFDEYASPNIFITLDRLEITLEEPLTPDEFSRQLLLQLEKQLSQLLRWRAPSISAANHYNITTNSPFKETTEQNLDFFFTRHPKSPLISLQEEQMGVLTLQNKSKKSKDFYEENKDLAHFITNQHIISSADNNNTASKPTFVTATKRLEDSLLFFLAQGYLPWYVSAEVRYIIQQEWDSILSNGSTIFITQLKNSLSNKHAMLLRFTGQTSTGGLLQLLQRWFEVDNRTLQTIAALLASKSLEGSEPLVWKKVALASLFLILLQDKDCLLQFNQQREIESILSIFNKTDLEKNIQQIETWEIIFRNWHLDDINFAAAMARQVTHQETTAVHTSNPATPFNHLVNEKQLDSKETSNSIHKTQLSESEHYFIDNAGIVLLCPFLPTLFQHLELTDDRKFVSPQAQEKATHILQFLCNGEQNSMEYEQLLNKLLCGLPLDYPLERFIQLSETECNACEGLLQEVIRRWTVLKNTTSTEVQQGFFARAGKLSVRSDDQWRLQIERKAIDVLLDKLPYGWGYTIIQMPWMPKMLFVEW